ncbi:TetR/AcrR family transcriptional regulator [Tsukamurella hominis]|uniref:TetR/AcrR family transcriptional regulator n=1 Tax=Tsukamurella hominis TaxID=1970232 RepID=UPI0039ED2FBD
MADERPRRDGGRYQDILDAFTRNVAERGYAGSNFSEIAAELDISKGTIVHHFGTKSRMFAQMHDGYMDRRIAEAQAITARFGSPRERLAGLLFAFLRYQEVDRSATVAFQREVPTLATHPDLEHSRELRSRHLGLVRDVIAAGVADGEFRDLDTEMQSMLLFGASQWAWTWYRPGRRLSAMEVGGQLVQLVLGGLLIDRAGLDDLADPEGAVAHGVAEIVAPR